MRKSIPKPHIDNNLYFKNGDIWWQKESPFYLLQSSLNPARIGYIKKKMIELQILPQGKTVLDIGCGGGSVCEEMARMGFNVIGIDPSEQSLKIAADHAKANGFQICYEKGTGEAVPLPDGSIDIVFCCDVLEHVSDLPKVLSEIARVLKPAGCFFYDTVNRTLLSKVVAIKISQEWRWFAFLPANLHVWSMFIKPREIKKLLEINSLSWISHMGIMPNVSFLKLLGYLHKRAAGKLSFKDFGEKLYMVESLNKNIMFMGYAVKK